MPRATGRRKKKSESDEEFVMEENEVAEEKKTRKRGRKRKIEESEDEFMPSEDEEVEEEEVPKKKKRGRKRRKEESELEDFVVDEEEEAVPKKKRKVAKKKKATSESEMEMEDEKKKKPRDKMAEIESVYMLEEQALRNMENIVENELPLNSVPPGKFLTAVKKCKVLFGEGKHCKDDVSKRLDGKKLVVGDDDMIYTEDGEFAGCLQGCNRDSLFWGVDYVDVPFVSQEFPVTLMDEAREKRDIYARKLLNLISTRSLENLGESYESDYITHYRLYKEVDLVYKISLPHLLMLLKRDNSGSRFMDFVENSLQKALIEKIPVFKPYEKELVHNPLQLNCDTQPPGLKTELFSYQLQAVEWMRKIENQVGVKHYISAMYKILPEDDNILFNAQEGLIKLKDDPFSCGWISANGGMFCDDVGLGKTLSMLTLISTNPLPKKAIEDKPTVNGFLVTGATLVLCPSHLVKQWKDEAKKHFKKPVKVVTLTVLKEFADTTATDIIDADVVIMSLSVLKNKNLQKSLEPMRPKWSSLRWGWKQMLDMNYPILENFYWHRFVLDEGHEAHKDKLIVQFVKSVKRRYSWYMTGTPFPSSEALTFAKELIGVQECPIIKQTEVYCDNALRKFLFWRNTKESTNQKAILPDVVEEVRMFDLTNVERAMYEENKVRFEKDTESLRQLCCHPQITDSGHTVFGSERKSMEEVRVLLLEQRRRDIVTKTHRLARIDQDIANTKRSTSISEFCRRDKLRMLNIDKEETARDIENIKHTIKYLEEVIPTLEHEIECPICFETARDVAMLPCGHTFCKQCIIAAVARKQVCPMCRTEVENKDIHIVSDTSSENSELEELKDRLGAKMAHMIVYLRRIFAEDSNNRVIIFSEWDRLLHIVGSTLAENDIPNTFVQGNVFQRNKAVSAFKEASVTKKKEGVKVIMLSLENCASGLNLTEATHLILLNSVSGTVEYAQAVETQAIGRVHRLGQKTDLKVVRFIARNTIEQELYEQNILPRSQGEQTTGRLSTGGNFNDAGSFCATFGVAPVDETKLKFPGFDSEVPDIPINPKALFGS